MPPVGMLLKNYRTRIAFAMLFLLLSAMNGYAQEMPNIDDYMKKYTYQYYRVIDNTLAVFEDTDAIQFCMMAYSEKGDPPSILAVRQNDHMVCYYGVLLGTSPDAYFLFDLDGDGSLDLKTVSNIVPNWVLFRTELERGTPDDFFRLCSGMYAQFNSAKGPDNAFMQEYIRIILERIRDKDGINRDLYYSLFHYIQYTENPQLALRSMVSLLGYIHKTFDEVLPLTVLFCGESLINLGEEAEALESFDLLAELDTGSMVADYYRSKLRDSLNGTTENMEAFMKNNQGFWMLKN